MCARHDSRRVSDMKVVEEIRNWKGKFAWDGQKVYEWNRKVWILLVIVFLSVIFLNYFH